MLGWERWTLTQSSGDAGVPVLVLALLLVAAVELELLLPAELGLGLLLATWAARAAAAVRVAVDSVAVSVVADVPDGGMDGDGECRTCREGDGEAVFPGLLLTLAGGDTVGE